MTSPSLLSEPEVPTGKALFPRWEEKGRKNVHILEAGIEAPSDAASLRE